MISITDNIVMIPITDCLKKCEFIWFNTAAKAFVEIEARMVSTLVTRLLDFSKIFEVVCDTSDIGIGEVLAHEGHLITYFSKKLSEAKQKYSTYDKEFYAVIQALRYWRHYLLP